MLVNLLSTKVKKRAIILTVKTVGFLARIGYNGVYVVTISGAPPQPVQRRRGNFYAFLLSLCCDNASMLPIFMARKFAMVFIFRIVPCFDGYAYCFVISNMVLHSIRNNSYPVFLSKF